MTTDEQQKTYEEIVKLFDFAEKIIDAIEQNPEPSPELRLKLVEPIIYQIEESADILSEIYIQYIETGKKMGFKEQVKAESAIRKIFAAINSYKESMKKIEMAN